MWEWIIDELFIYLMKQVLHALPNTDIDHIIFNYRWLYTQAPFSHPKMPPGLIDRYLWRWLSYPEFYNEFALVINSVDHSSDMYQALVLEYQQVMECTFLTDCGVALSGAFPLPMPTFTDPEVFKSAMSLVIDSAKYEIGVYPPDTTPQFDSCYWLCCYVVRTMFLAYAANETLAVLHVNPLPTRR